MPLKLFPSLLILVFVAGSFAHSSPQEKSAKDSVPAGRLISPKALNDILASAGKEKPVVLYVGPPLFFPIGHIPGAIEAGQTGDPSGMASFRKTLGKIGKKKSVVLYCGCCPWSDCPNIRPALKAARSMGYSKAVALDLPKNFKTDWAGKGYAVEKR